MAFTSNHSGSLRPSLVAVFAAVLLMGLPPTAMAGGGPENVLLVVNRDSTDSLTIANHYIHLRHIPPSNVLSLSWNPDVGETNVDTFREKILLPVLTEIDKRRLGDQIDYVVYSSDFPWAIDIKSDLDKFKAQADPTLKKYLTPVGSLNGLTFLWGPVVAGNAGYISLQSNLYMRGASPEKREPLTLGFSSGQNFGRRGKLLASNGRRYLLSVMLGVTFGRGNSVGEVINYLRRSARADGTHPRGTIYYVKHIGIRSTLRDRTFGEAVDELKKLGVAARVIPGTVPSGRPDVQGLMMGTRVIDWKKSGCTILPGAICENLTSFGGVMRRGASHTPLSEFLRHGAAGTSGTVTEPRAINELKFQPKFPAPQIQVHYARGCTLAEAFYQSVGAPYQLLIVGDPLCRPWANIPQVTVEGTVGVVGTVDGATVKGKLTLKPSATFAKIGPKVGRFRLFIDGWQRAECAPGESLELDTTVLADGQHDLRVVAIEAGWIRSQGRRIMRIATANHGRTITASIAQQGPVRVDRPLVVTANAPGCEAIVVLHHGRSVGTIKGEQGQVTIRPATLGYGPTSLQVVAVGNRGPLDYVMAAPLKFTVVAK